MGPVVIGVDLGGTNLRTALVSQNGEVADKVTEPSRPSEGHASVVQKLIANIKAQQVSALRSGDTVAAVGVGAPGVIHADTGVVIKSTNYPDWNNLPLKKDLEARFRISCSTDTDRPLPAR